MKERVFSDPEIGQVRIVKSASQADGGQPARSTAALPVLFPEEESCLFPFASGVILLDCSGSRTSVKDIPAHGSGEFFNFLFVPSPVEVMRFSTVFLHVVKLELRSSSTRLNRARTAVSTCCRG